MRYREKLHFWNGYRDNKDGFGVRPSDAASDARLGRCPAATPLREEAPRRLDTRKGLCTSRFRSCSQSQERASFSADRLRLLQEQPQTTPKFSKLGFKLMRAPPLLIDALQSYFELNKADFAREVRPSPVPELAPAMSSPLSDPQELHSTL